MATDWHGKKVVVVGLGATGIAAARLLLHQGASVLISESGPATDNRADTVRELATLGAEYEFDGHSVDKFTAADTIVLSPGVPPAIEPVAAARDAGVRTISELELAFGHARAPIVAVTGTNGKTTTCTLLHRMFGAAGIRPVYTGNTDMPFSAAVSAADAPDVYVIEVSSFQLELIETFRPDVGILLNVTPDHLERYHGLDHYAATKHRLFAHQLDSDYAVLNSADPYALNIPGEVVAQRVYFDMRRGVEIGCWLDNDMIRYRLRGDEGTICSTAEIAMPGRHNVENAMAACAGAVLMGARSEHCAAVLRGFPGLEHRIETVAEISNVTYVNDSKSTNVDSLRCALTSFDRPVVLIAGGRGKGERYDGLRDLVEQRVRAMVLIGEEADAIESELGRSTVTHRPGSLEEAVRTAADIARPGDVVLLSPACSSFDMFTDFKHRGTVFKQCVGKLENPCDMQRT